MNSLISEQSESLKLNKKKMKIPENEDSSNSYEKSNENAKLSESSFNDTTTGSLEKPNTLFHDLPLSSERNKRQKRQHITTTSATTQSITTTNPSSININSLVSTPESSLNSPLNSELSSDAQSNNTLLSSINTNSNHLTTDSEIISNINSNTNSNLNTGSIQNLTTTTPSPSNTNGKYNIYIKKVLLINKLIYFYFTIKYI